MRTLHHHYQTSSVNCGPAVARMLLERWQGHCLPERDLAVCLGTDAQGTRPSALSEGLTEFGLVVMEGAPGDFDALVASVEAGHDVIVLYAVPEHGVDHYALVAEVDADRIVLADPLFGPARRWAACCFKERWVRTTTTPEVPGGWWVSVR